MIACQRLLAGLLLAGLLGLAPAATSLAEPLRQGEGCTIGGTKTATPARIKLGESVKITLKLTPQCPPATFRAADIVVVMDVSRSMQDDGKIDAAKKAAKTFVQVTDLSVHRMGLIFFAGNPVSVQDLTTDASALIKKIDQVTLSSGTNISAALDAAKAMLDTQGRPGVLPVIILMSDGAPNMPTTGDPERLSIMSANAARVAGIEVFAIGLGRDAAEGLMLQLVTSPSHYFSSPDNAQLEQIYRDIAHIVGDVGIRDLALDDDLSADVTLEPNTPAPATTSVTGRRLTWQSALLASAATTEWNYYVKPTRLGTYPTNDKAVATYRDVDGVTRQFEFPKPLVTVLDPRDIPPCNSPNPWVVAVYSFPDAVGVGGALNGLGCNNQFDSGDWFLGTQFALPHLEYELTDETGQQVLFRAKGVPGPGRVDQRLQMRACVAPPYKLRLTTTDLAGYQLCPNSPAERLITARDFRGFKYRQERYGLVR